MHTTKKFKDLTQKKRQLSHFLNFYVFLTVELPRMLMEEEADTPARSTLTRSAQAVRFVRRLP